jgi:nucleoside-diphosphate-sugar epimerase
VLLTGASGTLGRNFLELVGHREDVSVLAVLRQESRQLAPLPSVEVVRVDGLDRATLARVARAFEPTCIVHCAATGMEFPRTEWFELIRFNVDLTVDLCECAAALPGCEFIFVSTGLAYRSAPRPLAEDDAIDTQHPYGASKAAADILVRAAAAEFGVPLTILRPFSFTGLGDDRSRLFATLLRAAEAGQPVELSPGTQVRDHCSARDIAAGIVRAVETGHDVKHRARIFNLGSGRDLPLRPLIEGVVAELGLEVPLRFGARPFARFEPLHLQADIRLAGRELGWAPRHNLAHAVWELARESFPGLSVRMPRELA